MTPPTSNLTTLVIGTIVFIATLAAWLIAQFNGIETGALLAFAIPVVGALFLGNAVSGARDAAQQAANQTNGLLEPRVKAAVASALSDRDAARTLQAGQSDGDTARWHAQHQPTPAVAVPPPPPPVGAKTP